MKIKWNHRIRRGLLTGLAVVALFVLTGCTAHAHVRPAHPHVHAKARVVVVEKGHVHSKKCGHYRHGGRWYYVKGHVHKAGCGHVHVKGVWVLRR